MTNNLVYATDKRMLYVNLIITWSWNYQYKLLLWIQKLYWTHSIWGACAQGLSKSQPYYVEKLFNWVYSMATWVIWIFPSINL